MKTVLAVDDSPSIRQMVGLTLRGAGYNVIEAVDGRDALERWSRKFGPVVKVDRMTKETIRNGKEKDSYA